MAPTPYLSPHRPAGSPAFTLLELLIVVVVLGMTALIVVPWGSSAAHSRLSAAARMLIADLDGARLRSMGRADDPCMVVFDAAGTGYFLARASDPSNPITDPISERPWRRVFGQDGASQLRGVSTGMPSTPDGRIAFTPRGALDGTTDATIGLSCQGRSLTVVTDAATGASHIQ